MSPKPGQYLTARLKTDPTQTQDEGAPLRISGVANDAAVTDSFGTRIKLSQRALDGFMNNPIMLLNHDKNNPIGKFTSVRYNGTQLIVEGEIDPGARTNTGASVADLAQKGILKAFSIRFDEAAEVRMKDHVQLDADVLDEISIVTLPSNRSSLFGLRSKGVELHGAPELLDEEDRGRVADLRTAATTRAAGPLSMELLTSRLRKLVRESEQGSDYYNSAYLVAVYDDVLIWTTWDDSRFYSRAYAVDASGNVSLQGDNQEVIPSWTPVGENAGTRTLDQGDTRLHPDDLAAIAAQVTRALQPNTRILTGPTSSLAPEPATPPPAPDAEIPLEEGLTQLRSLIHATPPAPADPAEPVPIDTVRSAIRAALGTTS